MHTFLTSLPSLILLHIPFLIMSLTSLSSDLRDDRSGSGVQRGRGGEDFLRRRETNQCLLRIRHSNEVCVAHGHDSFPESPEEMILSNKETREREEMTAQEGERVRVSK
jgi:hypothetical protein